MQKQDQGFLRRCGSQAAAALKRPDPAIRPGLAIPD